MNTLFIRRAAALVVVIALGTACKKEAKPMPEPEPYDKEVVLYVTPQNKVLNVGSSLFYSDETDSQIPSYLIEVRLEVRSGIKNDTTWIDKKTRYIRKDISAEPVTKIEIIANADYDDTHPKGCTLNDLLEIDYPKPDENGYLTKDLTEHFTTTGFVDWDQNGWFRLKAKTPPSKANEIYFHEDYTYPEKYAGVTVRLTLKDGSNIEIVPTDWGPMPTTI